MICDLLPAPPITDGVGDRIFLAPSIVPLTAPATLPDTPQAIPDTTVVILSVIPDS